MTPGDKVSLVLSLKDEGNGGSEETSQFLLQNVQVLAVGDDRPQQPALRRGGRVNQGKGSQTLTAVTLASTSRTSSGWYAAEYGSIYLTLMPPNAEDPAVPGVNGSNVIPPPDRQ